MRLTSRDYILVLWCLAHVLHLMVFGLMLHVLYVLIESMDTYRSMSMDGDIEYEDIIHWEYGLHL